MPGPARGAGDAVVREGPHDAGVAVVGSANLDVVLRVPRFTRPGETLLGSDLAEMPGGKGLNQAVAAARGGSCAFVGCVGADEAADLLLTHLEAGGVDTRHVQRSTSRTGRAFIEVTDDGENRIVVLSLANQDLDVATVRRSLAVSRPAVVLAQLEVPLETVVAAAEWAGRNDARFVLNPSPLRSLPPDLLAASDPLVVNALEARALLEEAGHSGVGAPPSLSAVAAALAAHARSVVVTDGPGGVHVAGSPDDVIHVPGVPVDAVDTTGAGDEFAGKLAAELARGTVLPDAAGAANLAAARAVSIARPDRS